MMKQRRKTNKSRFNTYGVCGSIFVLILTATLLFFPMNASATSINTFNNRAFRWCDDYKHSNPGQRCVVESRIHGCYAGTRAAHTFGGPVRGVVACISGNVATKHTLDYVLQCRGGGRMFARVPVNGDIGIYNFARASVAANTQKPAAGQCAFLDRPLSSSEPTQLKFKEKHAPMTHVDISATAVQPGWQNSPIVPVLKAIKTGQLFYVHVRNDRGWLDILRVGP